PPIEHSYDPRVVELRHLARAAEETLEPAAVRAVLPVEDLDRDQPLLLPVIGLPDRGEPALAERLDEPEPAVGGEVSRLEPAALPQLPAQVQDLPLDRPGVASRNGQLLLAPIGLLQDLGHAPPRRGRRRKCAGEARLLRSARMRRGTGEPGRGVWLRPTIADTGEH